MSETPRSAGIVKFLQIWQESFTRFLGQLGVVSPNAAFAPDLSPTAISPEEIAKSVSVRFSGGGSLIGRLLWLADTPVALQLAQLLTSEPLNPAAEFSDTSRDAFAELLRQVAGLAATAWKLESGGEAEFIFLADVEPASEPAQIATLRLSGEKIPDLSLSLLLDADLCGSLATAPPAASVPDEPVEPRGPLPANLDLLLDVELEATIRFGEREMLLRDILSLMPGAVVELNQSVGEPADLLVAGRLVARGEVVVVDGNFGLRVTEVASPGQRAALLQS